MTPNYGLQKGLLKTVSPGQDPRMFGLRSLRTITTGYLTDLHVPFVDSCCTNNNTGFLPVSYNTTVPQLQYWNGTAYVPISGGGTEIPTATPINVTATLTPAQLATKYITSTSVAAVALTLPTAATLATYLGAGAGSIFTFLVDNTAGVSVVTTTVNTGITAITPVITGSNTLTVAAGAVGEFKLIFTSATAAKLVRIA